MLNSIVVTWECDGCGSRHAASIDPGRTVASDTTVFDLAEYAIKESTSHDAVPHTGRHLCSECADEVPA